MSILPFRYARAFFRAACGLPPRSLPGLEIPFRPREVPLVMPTLPPDPVGPAPFPASRRLTGFVRLEVDEQKKATSCLLLFADGQVLTAELEGASEPSGRFVSASFRLQGPVDRPRPACPVAAAVRHACFQACDH